jgi:hypothetical protein
MKTSTTCLMVLFIAVQSLSQISFDYAKAIGYSPNIFMNDMTEDSNGNIYLVGSFTVAIDLDPGSGEDLHYTEGSTDVFLVKLTAEGDYVWGRSYGNNDANSGNAIAYDAINDRIIVGGTSEGYLTFDGLQTNFSLFDNDAFVYAISPDGDPIWVGSGNSTFNITESLADLVIDQAGNIFYACRIGNSNTKITKLNSNGASQYSNYIISAGAGTPSYLTLGSDGNLHLAGVFVYSSNSPYNFGAGSFTFGPGETSTNDNIFYAKIAPADAVVLDAKICTTSGSMDKPTGIVADQNGNIYISGHYHSLSGPASVFGLSAPEVPDNDENGFVVKIDLDNTAQSWIRVFPAQYNYTRINALDVDAAGLVYVYGISWPGEDVDPTSNGITAMQTGQSHFLTRLNNDGSFADASFFSVVSANNLMIQANGGVLIAGVYSDGNDFDPQSGTYNLPPVIDSPPNQDGFLLRLKTCSDPDFEFTSDTVFCESAQVDLVAESSTGDILWYSNADDIVPISVGSTYSPTLNAGVYTTWAEAILGECSSGREALTFIINELPQAPETAGDTICEPGQVSLSALSSAPEIFWYTNATGGTPVYIGNYFETDISITTTFYAESFDGCSSEPRVPVLALLQEITALATVNTSGTSLEASAQSNAAFQWINCDDNTPITGANAASYYPEAPGSYAVMIIINGCSNTSECVNYSGIGISEQNMDDFSIFPNPVSGIAQIKFNTPIKKCFWNIYNVAGQKVLSENCAVFTQMIDCTSLTPGIYQLILEEDMKVRKVKFVVE